MEKAILIIGLIVVNAVAIGANFLILDNYLNDFKDLFLTISIMIFILMIEIVFNFLFIRELILLEKEKK